MAQLNDIQKCIVAQTCLKEAVNIVIAEKSLDSKFADVGLLCEDRIKDLQKRLMRHTIDLVEKNNYMED